MEFSHTELQTENLIYLCPLTATTSRHTAEGKTIRLSIYKQAATDCILQQNIKFAYLKQ